MNAAIGTLVQLAKADPSVAPLALLRAEALRHASDPAWARAVPDVSAWNPEGGAPALSGARLKVNRAAADALLAALLGVVRDRAGSNGYLAASGPDAVALLEATVGLDATRIAEIAASSGVDAGLLAAVGEQLAYPLLRACGISAQPVLEDTIWDRGYCPVCGAWPTLAEVRGTERGRWLRCGRCGSGWRWLHSTCAYCGNDSHRTRGYIAAENAMESRQAATCDACKGYLKNVATHLPLDSEELLLKDLSTLELDVAAVARGYARPATAGCDMNVRIEPA